MNIGKKHRVVSLVDMDCFYVQVVQRKDPSLVGKPCAVVQYKAWKGGGIIAVGYEARKFGVTRQMRGDDAKQKCPDIVLVHVPESRGKADLTQFREAGAEVIAVLSEFTDCLERASIDEAYMDLTHSIERYRKDLSFEDVAIRSFQSTHLMGLDNLEVKMTMEELLECDLFKQWTNTLKHSENYDLAIGAVIAHDMRKAVTEKTGFSCSAGIGPNKVLAKFVAGFHKPNQQTLILPQNVPKMFQTTKIKNIRSLGGKLGAQLEEKLKVEFMSELCSFSLSALQTHVGEKNGELVYWLCRGVDHEPVRPRQLPKSVGCSKNFRGREMLTAKQDVYKWISNLVEEVWERLEKDREDNKRVATLFTVGCVNEKKTHQTKRCSVVNASSSLEQMTKEAFRSLSDINKKHNADIWHPGLVNLSFVASKFESTAASAKSINKYMSCGNNSTILDDTHGKISSPPKKKKKKEAMLNYFSSKTDMMNMADGGKSTSRGGNEFVKKIGMMGESVSSVGHNNGSQSSSENPIISTQTDDDDDLLKDTLPEDPLDFTCGSSIKVRSQEGEPDSGAKTTFPCNANNLSHRAVCGHESRTYQSNSSANDKDELRATSKRSIQSLGVVGRRRNGEVQKEISCSTEMSVRKASTSVPDPSMTIASCEKPRKVGEMVRNVYSNVLDAGKKPSRAFPNCGVINFANASFAAASGEAAHNVNHETNLVPSVEFQNQKSKQQQEKHLKRLHLDSEKCNVSNKKSSTTSHPSTRKGFFASLKENREKLVGDSGTDRTFIKNCHSEGSCSIRTSSLHVSKSNVLSTRTASSNSTTSDHNNNNKNNKNNRLIKSTGVSREGYFASLQHIKSEPNVDSFFALSQSQPSINHQKVPNNHETSTENSLTNHSQDQQSVKTKHNVEDSNAQKNKSSMSNDTSRVTSNDTIKDASDASTSSSIDLDSDMMVCDKCKKRILVWDLPEHMDYHYAKQVQNSMKKDFLSLYSNTFQGTPCRKKKGRSGNPSMKSYFEPTKKL